MGIISFSRDAVIDYVPAYGGNRGSADPCVVGLRFVPHGKVQEYSRLIAARGKGIDAGDADKRLNVSHEVQKRQFVENVASVTGFRVDGRDLSTAEELYDHAPIGLIYELLAAMQDSASLDEGQRKNSLPASAGER